MANPLTVSIPLVGQIPIKIGKVVSNLDQKDWEFLIQVPEGASWEWVFSVAPYARHSSKGTTVMESPMKEWEIGRGIIVRADDEGLFAIVRTDKHTYWFVRYKDLSKLTLSK